jgi:NitT/TauT family transport system substrate-binding protein
MIRFVQGFSLALAGVLSLVACGGSSSTTTTNASGTKVVSGALVDYAGSCTYWGHAPVLAGINKGWFKADGADVQFQTVVNSSDRLLALTSGSVGWSDLGQLATIGEMAKGNKSFYAVGVIDSGLGVEGVAAKPGITSIAGLKGKKVAVPFNSSAQVTLTLLLQDNGLTIKDVQLVNLPINDITAAFTRGQVDAYSGWEPTLSNAVKALSGSQILAKNDETKLYKKTGMIAAGNILIMSRELVDKNPATAKNILHTLTKALAVAKSNPSDLASEVTTCFKTDIAGATAGIQTIKFSDGGQAQNAAQSGLLDLLNLDLDFAFSNGMIASKPDPTQWLKANLWPKT